MNPKDIHPIIALSIIVVLSLLTAAVLFGVLSSTGVFKNQYVQFGGAAAGFFVAWYGFSQWYAKMEKERDTTTGSERDKLLERVKQLGHELQTVADKLEDTVSELKAVQERGRGLAQVIANLFAKDIVRDAVGDPDALDTLYQDTVRNWPAIFLWAEESPWLAELQGYFDSAVLLEARQVPELKSWRIPTAPLPRVAEVIEHN